MNEKDRKTRKNKKKQDKLHHIYNNNYIYSNRSFIYTYILYNNFVNFSVVLHNTRYGVTANNFAIAASTHSKASFIVVTFATLSRSYNMG